MEQHLKQSSPFSLFFRLISAFWQRSTTRRKPVNQAEGSSVWLKAIFTVVISSLLLGTGGLATAKETITYIHSDISGSPLAATDAAGNVLWKESYFAYGQKTEWQPESEAQTQWFHGKEQDADTTMQYFGARYYDPGIGRFLGIDPVDYQDGNLHSFNRYAYGNNNPTKYLDPDGRIAFLIPFALTATAHAARTVALRFAVTATVNASRVGIVAGEIAAGEALGGAALAGGAAAVGTTAVKGIGEFGNAANYRAIFKQARPDLPRGWQVHHSMPQKYEEVLSAANVNVHDIQFLRGVSPQVHSKITTEWARFDKAAGGNPSAAQIADFAKQLDKRYDGSFMWPGF